MEREKINGIGPAPLCATCRHFRDVDEIGLTCDAFPAGIPDDILTGELDHREPVAGDNGLQYEEKPAN